MVVALVGKAVSSIIGSRNDRLVKAYTRRVQAINAVEAEVRKLTDAQLRERTGEFRDRLATGAATTAELLPQILATAREAMDRSVGIRNIFNPDRHFDCKVLPAEAQRLYAQVAEQIAATPDIEEAGCAVPTPGWMQVEIPIALYDAVRKWQSLSRPPFRARPFDVQLIGGMVLSEGRISEMKTGEGKTIVAPLACYIACVEGLQCHVVTVNDYLVQRDRDWVFPFYRWLGLTVGAIHPYHMQSNEQKQQMYLCNVVYGTNAEFGFDYLRDNMKLTVEEQVQKHRDFCIIDEVDSILIDEARTPLIISGPAHDDAPRYDMADGVARHLIQKQKDWDAADLRVKQTEMKIKGIEGDIRNTRDKAAIPAMREEMRRLQELMPQLEQQRDRYIQYYEVEREKKAAHLTHEGVAEAQKVAGIGSFYVGNNMDVPHLLENALRAHAVYQRDKDYVVQGGEVIIVDEFTGRLMIGRQWSDGLHQAVEAKERVKIKQETQTLATVTIQNFFKLYKRLAGMTGTAITEAHEFNEIYKLDVVCIPTNVPVIRNDYDDVIYLTGKDKWWAILDEIKRMHDVGRPVLVGTTSVENSEMLAQMLQKRHGIPHEVLNAKQHEREAHIVEHAGELGAVMIATNMAGRGTDIRLQPIDRAALIAHWQRRDLLPHEARAEMGEEELLQMAYRHMAQRQLGLKPAAMQDWDDRKVRRRLLEHWVEKEGWRVQWLNLSWWQKALLYPYFITPEWHEPEKIPGLSDDQLLVVLDALPSFMFHRLRLYQNVEEMGGLHIVGTERHESRRIDNQLRGRAGRQGDHGSSRFYISLEDDLMKLFAGKTTLAALSRLGMKEGDALEHRWLTRSVERAQRKVEERNFEIRKNLLEYDEVMEYQRNTFYGIRQDVLEGRNVRELIFDYFAEAIEDAVDLYLDKEFTKTQVAEWCRQELDVSIEPGRLRLDDAAELDDIIRREARNEAMMVIDVTIGEYMGNEMPPEEWDLRGLCAWAMSRFSVDLKQNQVRQMTVEEVKKVLGEAAAEQIEKKDLGGVGRFMDKLYARRQLADWAKQKFNVEVDPAQVNVQDPKAVAADILAKAKDAYRRRELEYPIDFALDMTFALAQHDQAVAGQQLVRWAKHRYQLDLEAQELSRMSGLEIRSKLLEAARPWVEGDRLEQFVDQAVIEHGDAAALAQWASTTLGQTIAEAELADPGTRRERLLAAGRTMLRTELNELERYVLLQILDVAWKDHLYAMDQLKDSVGLRGYAEKDPRIEYKREGANQFRTMQKTVRERVTELIFRARLTPDFQARNVYGSRAEARHDSAKSLAHSAATAGTDQQRADLEAAEHAGHIDDGDQRLTRKQRRAREAAARHGDSGDDGDKAPASRQPVRRKKRRR